MQKQSPDRVREVVYPLLAGVATIAITFFGLSNASYAAKNEWKWVFWPIYILGIVGLFGFFFFRRKRNSSTPHSIHWASILLTVLIMAVAMFILIGIFIYMSFCNQPGATCS